MDELTQAFAGPTARAAATAGATPCDRISVRDHVREVEIGAFQSERGVTQRIRFNIVLEISAHVAARDDDVDKVVSYDTIIHAIEDELAAERLNLLETLAERIAARILIDRRALRVFVRIEKLDRIPGALGVEIVRSRKPADAPEVLPSASPAAERAAPSGLVFLDTVNLSVEILEAWLRHLAGLKHPPLVSVPPLASLPEQPDTEAGRRVTLLSMDQSAWCLAALDPRAVIVDSRTEIDHALKERLLPITAPHRLVAAAVTPPDDITSQGIALWTADLLGVSKIDLVAKTDGHWPADRTRFHAPDQASLYGPPDL